MRLLEAMMVGLPEADGALSAEAAEPGAGRRSTAPTRSCSGPGLSKKPGARAFALEMFERIDVPLVIDADGLNALRGRASRRTCRSGRGRPCSRRTRASSAGCSDVDSAEVGARAARARPRGGRQGARVRGAQGRRHAGRLAQRAASRSRAAARPALATAGTGDVLSGVIGAMLAKGLAGRPRRVRRRLRARARRADRRGAARRRRRDRLRRDPRASRALSAA